jgi:hypothetical protein
MSELTEPVWGVISERGCEASRLTYEAARELLDRLGSEGVYGRCIVSSRAAERLQSGTASTVEEHPTELSKSPR